MNQNWIILKFGGSSVGEIHHWRTITEQVQHQLEQGHRPLLVLSALKNVSNLLEALLHQSLAGVHANAIFQLKELHIGFASQLGLNGEQLLASHFDKLVTFCETIHQQQKITPEDHAKVLAIGELLGKKFYAAYSKYVLVQKTLTLVLGLGFFFIRFLFRCIGSGIRYDSIFSFIVDCFFFYNLFSNLFFFFFFFRN